MAVKLEWITPDADKQIGFIARVSNVNAQPDDPVDKLIQYLIDHKHWSPFEMACACVEITTTRDIGRQILRHGKGFHFQEFSQRYAKVLPEPVYRQARLQDKKNRQNSITTDDKEIIGHWDVFQGEVWDIAHRMYKAAINLGIAKEVARALLPEGMVQTKMYMQGTIRDWLHYIAVRTGPETQFEHRIIANEIRGVLEEHCPTTFQAAKQAGLING